MNVKLKNIFNMMYKTSEIVTSEIYMIIPYNEAN